MNSRTLKWNELKNLHKETNTTPEISYRKSSTNDIIDAIDKFNNLKSNKTEFKNTYKKAKKYKNTRKNELYSIYENKLNEQGKTPEPYKKTTIKSLKSFLSQDDFINFFKNPVHEKEIDVNVKDFNLLESISNLKYNNDFVILISFRINNEIKYRLIKNTKDLNDYIKEISKGYKEIKDNEIVGSDREEIIEFMKYNPDITFIWNERSKYGKTNSGGFFDMFNISKFNLERYQIYTKDQKIDDENCIIYSIKNSNLSDETKNKVDYLNFNDMTIFRDLKILSEELGICINVKYLTLENNNFNTRNRTYNKNKNEVLNLGLVNNHYFINEETRVTSPAINHYDALKDDKNFPFIKKYKNHYFNEANFISSFNLISGLFKKKNKFFVNFTIENFNRNINNDFQREIKEIGNLVEFDVKNDSKRNDLQDSKEKIFKFTSRLKAEKGYDPDDPNNNFDVLFIDFETFNSKKEDKHKPYCLSYSYMNSNNIYTIYGLECAKQFLNSLESNTVIIAHNLGFDFRFLLKHLNDVGPPLETGTRLKHIQAKYNNLHLVSKDSMAFLAAPLKTLPSMFSNMKNLNIEKEVYPYTLINEDNYSSLIDIEEVNQHLKDEDKEQFLNNCKKLNCINKDNEVDIKKYTEFYCELDVKILKMAYINFRDQMKLVTSFDILTLVSLPQLANKFLTKEGAFEDTYKISGMANKFMSKAIHGGRVMTAFNKKHHVIDKVEDLDAVSLYPSAMVIMDGFLKGTPKLLNTRDLRDLNKNANLFSGYFVEIEILDLKKPRSFPLLSIQEKQKNGANKSKNFTNDVIGKKFVVDKTQLQDLKTYHKIEYKTIRGYKFTNGFNTKIKTIIKKLFQKRKDLKKDENDLQLIYKLILNASYGKLIQKPILKTKSFYENSNDHSIKNYIIKNCNTIEEFSYIRDDMILVKQKKSSLNHFSSPHLASQILSTSKRIMNEVMFLAEDNNMKIFYQDTDSMHLLKKDVKNLEKFYEEKFNRKLIGNDLGQFHGDFSVNDKNLDKNHEISSVESYFIGKKVYVDKLEYKTKDNLTKHAYHVRMKGITGKAVFEKASNEYNNDMMSLFKDLYDGKKIEFDLLKYCPLKLTKNYNVINNKEFLRTVQF